LESNDLSIQSEIKKSLKFSFSEFDPEFACVRVLDRVAHGFLGAWDGSEKTGAVIFNKIHDIIDEINEEDKKVNEESTPTVL
jgi:hypothetical protein